MPACLQADWADCGLEIVCVPNFIHCNRRDKRTNTHIQHKYTHEHDISACMHADGISFLCESKNLFNAFLWPQVSATMKCRHIHFISRRALKKKIDFLFTNIPSTCIGEHAKCASKCLLVCLARFHYYKKR